MKKAWQTPVIQVLETEMTHFGTGAISDGTTSSASLTTPSGS